METINYNQSNTFSQSDFNWKVSALTISSNISGKKKQAAKELKPEWTLVSTVYVNLVLFQRSKI